MMKLTQALCLLCGSICHSLVKIGTEIDSDHDPGSFFLVSPLNVCNFYVYVTPVLRMVC